MKEALGQTISLQVILVFMVFLNAFLAFSVNYTKAFRVKNKVINEIEQNAGLNNTAEQNITKYMSTVGYKVDVDRSNSEDEICYQGVCITPHCIGPLGRDVSTVSCNTSGNPKVTNYRVYYSVKTYININVPIINRILSQDLAIFKVQGDTSTVYVNGHLADLISW